MFIIHESSPATSMKWGQLTGAILVAAFVAVYAPIWLLYAGAVRFVWCVLGGQAGRGLLSLIAFALAYVGIAWLR